MGLFDSLFGKATLSKIEELLNEMLSPGNQGLRLVFERKVISEARFGTCLLYVPSRQPVDSSISTERLTAEMLFPENGFRIESEGKIYLVAFTSLDKLKSISQAEHHWAIPSKVLCDKIGRASVKNLLLNPNCPDVFWISFEGGIPAGPNTGSGRTFWRAHLMTGVRCEFRCT
jgi:hypothetical protein